MTSNVTFLQEMDGLNREVREMADRANEAIEKAVKLIATGDDVLMKDVHRLDKELYHYDNLVEKHCLDLIALYSPVAGDLRIVSTCLKIIEDLNRIGRYAHDIAESISSIWRNWSSIWSMTPSTVSRSVMRKWRGNSSNGTTRSTVFTTRSSGRSSHT